MFAEPATTWQRSSGIVSSLITAPMAQGAKMSHSWVWMVSGSVVSTPKSRTARATASTDVSDTTTFAPASTRCLTK